MAVFRIDKSRDYTVMANFHLRDRSLSLKAKGLLSLMLSLPENWDYTTKGLACICKDGVDSICSTVKELEQAGYVKRRRLRDAQGRLSEVEYTILEKPDPAGKSSDSPKLENPVLDKPVLDFPEQAKPKQEKPEQENPAQLSIQELNKQESNTDQSSIHSFFPPEAVADGQKDAKDERDKIRHQIEYDWLREQYRPEAVDELVEIMLDVSMNRSPTIRIGRDAEYPTAYVRERFSKITVMHIERVLEGIADNRTQVRNTKAYLLAALFNSVSTLDHHCTMQYNHDFGGSV